MTDTREAFELKVSIEYEQPPCIERDGDGYMDGYVDNAWWGWQAAEAHYKERIAELEEVLKNLPSYDIDEGVIGADDNPMTLVKDGEFIEWRRVKAILASFAFA